MGLTYKNLDGRTRSFMAEEIAHDQSAKALYLRNRLTEEGARNWPRLFGEAAANHDDSWLANEIQSRGYLKSHEERKNPTGGVTLAKVPITAHTTLAEGEFNRCYVRGICRRAIDDGISHVIAYRARHSENPRPESEAIVGKSFDPHSLLQDLRSSTGVEPALGVPPGPNSGLSVRLP